MPKKLNEDEEKKMVEALKELPTPCSNKDIATVAKEKEVKESTLKARAIKAQKYLVKTREPKRNNDNNHTSTDKLQVFVDILDTVDFDELGKLSEIKDIDQKLIRLSEKLKRFIAFREEIIKGE